jgi:hypothetical protein
MGKKNRKKLKKLMRSNLEQNQRSTEPKLDENLAQAPNQPDVKPMLSEEDHEVKKEIRKILITIGIMILAIVAVYLINVKSNIILQAGQWMVDKLNLSI